MSGKIRKRIVILGGGFGGVYTAQCLLSCRQHSCRPEILLVSRNPYFEFKPLFVEVLGKRLAAESARFRLKSIFRDDRFRIKNAVVTGIDAKRSVVTTDRGELIYDYLVVALGGGSMPVPTTRQASLFSLESIEECVRLRDRIDELCRHSKNSRRELSKPQRTVAIIGAGPTGVEAAAEMAHILNTVENSDAVASRKHDIILLDSTKRILPGWGKHLRVEAESVLREYDVDVRTAIRVDRIGKSRIYLENGTAISAATTVWCGGLEGLPIYSSFGAATDKSRHLKVNSFLQLPKFKNIYAMGDSISTERFPAPVPQGAQAAYQQAKVIVHNILSATAKKPLRPFRYVELGEIIPVGGRRALARVLGVPMSGFLAWGFEKGVHIQRVPGWTNKMRLLSGVALDPLAQKGEEYLQKRRR